MKDSILNSLFLLLLIRSVCTVPVTKTLENKEVHFCDTLEDSSLSEICHKERKPLQICGGELANLMRHVCGSSTGLLSPDDTRRWISKRVKRTIANDCCLQTCSVSQIIYQYCADPLKVFKDRQKILGFDDEEKTPYKLKIEQTSMEGRKSLEDKANGKVRNEIKRKNNIKRKRKEKCGCRKRKMKWGKIPKFNYPPHKRGEVSKSSQPVIFGTSRDIRLLPLAVDNTLVKDWSS